MLPPGGKRFSLILYRKATKCTFNITKNVCCYWCLEKKFSVESFTLVMFWSAAIPDPADSCVCQGCDPNQQWNKMTIRTCLIARGLYNTRHLANRAVIKVNSESPLSVSALSLSICLTENHSAPPDVTGYSSDSSHSHTERHHMANMGTIARNTQKYGNAERMETGDGRSHRQRHTFSQLPAGASE